MIPAIFRVISADSRKSAATAEIVRRESGKIGRVWALARSDRRHPPHRRRWWEIFRPWQPGITPEGGAGTRATSHAERMTNRL